MPRYHRLMQIFKLKYESQELAVSDLIEKGILTEDLNFTFPVHAVVDLGLSVAIKGIYDEDGNELKPPVYDGYCYDLMIEDVEYDFSTNLIEPQTPDHTFAGYDLPLNEIIEE